MKKKIAAITAAVLFAALAACGGGDGEPKTSPSPSPSVSPSPTSSASPSPSSDSGKETPKSGSQNGKTDTQTMTGVYSGRIDSNSIEVTTGQNSFSVFQLSEELKKEFDSDKFTEGDQLNIEYSKKDEQLVAKSITKAE